MANNTLGEWSDGEDDWVFEINESTFLPQTVATNTLGEFSDGEDDFVFEIDESLWNNSCKDDGNEVLNQITTNTLGEFSDGEDDFVFETDENARANSDDDLIRSIDEDQILNQTGHGEKRKVDEQLLPVESGEDYYSIETKKKHHSKKFGMTATDHIVRFNNVLHDVDLLESQERTHTIFQHLIEDVTTDMNPNDHVRFILRSDQLQTPISIPFLPLEKLTTEKVLSQVEKVVQSNEEFRLNDTVTIDIIHV